MSEKCYKCFRPLKSCYCKYVKEIKTPVKFIFLMHPKEAYHQKTGTGRLASLSLPDSEILIGVDFTQNKRLNELLKDDSYYPVLMYPGEDAWTAAKKGFATAIGNKKLLVILVDATWFFAKKILRLSPNLYSIPKLSFRAGYTSQYTFKRQPEKECLSTIETCYYLLNELQHDAVIPSINTEPLMNIFHRLIDYQISAEKERRSSGAPDRHAVPAKKRSHISKPMRAQTPSLK